MEHHTFAHAFELGRYRNIVFFTGAGISAASGLPTYQGEGGIWEQYDYTSYASAKAFAHNPQRVWEFHNDLRQRMAQCKPNRAHELIARAQQVLTGSNVTVITQNGDGLHQLAGSADVIELHGSIWKIRCDACGQNMRTRQAPLEELHCACKAWWRPDIVWFGDALDAQVLSQAKRTIKECDLLVSVGTSGLVQPAARLPLLAQRRGALMVEINPSSTEMSYAYRHTLRAGAQKGLELLCKPAHLFS